MLLDAHSLKNILIEMTMVGAEHKSQPSASHLKILSRGIAKIEKLLKVLLRPHDPPNVIVETYNLLYGDYDISNLTKILELKVLFVLM